MARHLEQGRFLRSRADQVADYLRGCIARGELTEPLPGIRGWASRLGIGHSTLETSLRILHREGLVRVRPRSGIQLLSAPPASAASEKRFTVRWISLGKDSPDKLANIELFDAVFERLALHGIRLSVERHNSVRLQAIHRRGEVADEMFCLSSFPRKFQELFADFRKSALIVGLPFPEVPLPYVSNDVFSAIRHATHYLARRGFPQVRLVLNKGRQMLVTEELFERACVEAVPPVRGAVVLMPLELEAQVAAAVKFAARVSGRQGVVAVHPIPASLLMTALMKRGIDVPGQVEVVALNTPIQAIRAVPRPTYYRNPTDALAKAICRAALQYFDRGNLPRLRKMIPLEVAPSAH